MQNCFTVLFNSEQKYIKHKENRYDMNIADEMNNGKIGLIIKYSNEGFCMAYMPFDQYGMHALIHY